MKIAAAFQFTTGVLGFTIVPALWNDAWVELPSAFRWTVFGSQLLLMLSGWFLAKSLGRHDGSVRLSKTHLNAIKDQLTMGRTNLRPEEADALLSLPKR